MDLENKIQLRSYYLWLAAGKPEGKSEYFWRQAEKEELWEAMQASIFHGDDPPPYQRYREV